MKKVMSPEFRVSFPALFKPVAFQNQDPKYSVTMLIPKSADISKLRALAAEAVNEKWPDKNKRPKVLKHPFRDGDSEKPDIDGYAGHWFIKASSKMQPGLIDQNLQPIIAEEEFYAGCYARATVTAYAYDNVGQGVAFGLQNVQKLRDGAPFGGRTKAEDDFDVVETDDFTAASAAEAGDDMFQ